jgi:arginase
MPGKLTLQTTRQAVVTHFAARAGDHNDRAMQGSRILANELARRLDVMPVVVGSPEPALSVNWDAELSAARPALREMAWHYDKVFRDGHWPVTALSRCAVALATLPVVARHRPDAVVVWFDAHADLNTPDSTTTGYLGGLALSGPLGLWNSGLGAGLSPEHAILCGARDIDPAEQTLIDEGTIKLVAHGPHLAKELKAAISGRAVYVHVDCDVLDPGIVPTDYRVEHGLSLDDLNTAAAIIAKHEVVGIEIGEFESPANDTSTPGDIGDPGDLLDALHPLLTKAE